MSKEDLGMHNTITTLVLGDEGIGWEFTCENCGYHARYIVNNHQTPHQLEILDPGNPNVQHKSDLPMMNDDEANTLDAVNAAPVSSGDTALTHEEVLDDEKWLTPEIREKLEAIVKKLDD
ncbi:MAG: hypothetical protein ACM3PY_00950 [Omnitrophica WOR_2 bacterium]